MVSRSLEVFLLEPIYIFHNLFKRNNKSELSASWTSSPICGEKRNGGQHKKKACVATSVECLYLAALRWADIPSPASKGPAKKQIGEGLKGLSRYPKAQNFLFWASRFSFPNWNG